MSQFNDPTYGNPPPKKKSSATMWIIIAVVTLIGLPLLCCGGCALVGYWGIGMAGQQIATELQNEPAVKEHLGDNLKLQMNLTKTGQEGERAGGAAGNVAVFDATGSKGSGDIIVTTVPGKPGVQSAKLRKQDGTEIPIK